MVLNLLLAAAVVLVLQVPQVPQVLQVHLEVLQVHLEVLVDQVVEVTAVDTDPEFYNLDITKDGLALVYRSVCFHLDKWSGGHPDEQVALQQLKDNLFRIILEKTLER